MEEFTFTAMGTDCTILLGDCSSSIAIEAAGAVTAEIERIEDRYSRYRSNSLASEINRLAGSGGEIALDPETSFLIDFAFMAHGASDGAFDITSGVLRQVWGGAEHIPTGSAVDEVLDRVGLDKVIWRPPVLRFAVSGMEIDFGGLAKEYAADRAAKICRRAGVTRGLVNLGGDIAIVGTGQEGRAWAISIRDPRGGDSPLATLTLANGGLATSGDTERALVVDGRRFSHIYDPRTGWPVEGLRSVSVVAESTLLAGALSTIAMLKGVAGVEWLKLRDCSFIALGSDNQLWSNGIDLAA